MLDPNINVEKKEAANYKPLPDDMYQVEFFDVTAEKRPTYDTRNLADDEKIYETVFNFQFVVLEETVVEGDSIRGRYVYENFVPSFLYIGKNGKNTLYNIIEALQGQTISPEQEAFGISGKDINNLIGKQCRVVTKQKTKGDKTFMNIDSYLPAKINLTPLSADEKQAMKAKAKDAGETVDPTEADVPDHG
jgi:hypothetical protein